MDIEIEAQNMEAELEKAKRDGLIVYGLKRGSTNATWILQCFKAQPKQEELTLNDNAEHTTD